MATYKLGVIQPRFPFVGVEILTTFWFLWRSFGSRYARKSIKASKDSDDSLVSKKNLSKKLENPKPKTNFFFFFNLNQMTC